MGTAKKSSPIVLIAAITRKYGLGKDNDLLVRSKIDMKHFMSTTTGNVVVMGSNTFKSLNYTPLKNRINYVLADNLNANDYMQFDNLVIFKNIDNLKNVLKSHTDETIYVIGGGMMYEQFLDDAQELLLTEFEIELDADVFFPKFDKTKYSKQYLQTFADAKHQMKPIIGTIVRYTKR